MRGLDQKGNDDYLPQGEGAGAGPELVDVYDVGDKSDGFVEAEAKPQSMESTFTLFGCNCVLRGDVGRMPVEEQDFV